MFKNIYARLFNCSVLLAVLVSTYGCKGSGGGDNLGPSLGLGGGGGAISDPSSSSVIIPTLTGGDTPPLHAPEPATIALLGTGMLAWHMLNKRKK